MSTRWIDLSHPVFDGMPVLSVMPAVTVERYAALADGMPVNSSRVSLPLHAGTHVDAPNHVIEGAASIDEVPAERFEGRAAVVRVDVEAGELITVADVEAGGPLPESSDMLIINSGWHEHYGDDAYHDHPSLDPELAEWCVERELRLVGVDFFSPDLPVSRRGSSPELTVHRILLGNGVLVAENLTNLDVCTGRFVHVHALPVLFKGADAGPARILARDE